MPAGVTVAAPDPCAGLPGLWMPGRGPDLLDRFLPLAEGRVAQARAGLLPGCTLRFGRIGPRGSGRLADGRERFGIDLAAQDSLSLAAHPAVLEAAHAAVAMYGVHAGGPPLPVGLSPPLADLETRLAAFLGLTGATVFPTGWSAGYGALRTLLRPADHVLIDVGAPACLQAGAQASTARVHRLARCDAAAVAPRLARLRAEEPAAGLLVVAAALRGTDSDSPDLAALQSACRDHHATLLVDVSEDLGAMGPGGRGVAAAQGMHGRLDVVCGSFAACLGADGGFVAGSHPALGQALRHVCTVHTASAALSPVAAAVVLAALEIVEGGEGAARRERLAANVGRLRAGLAAAGFAVAGVASPVVPVVLGSSAVARPLTARLMAAGAFVELLEHPAVARDAGRWRLRPMAGHSDVDIDEFVALASRARERTDD